MIIIFIELCRIADSLLWIPKSSRRTSSTFYIPNIIALLKMESQQLHQNPHSLQKAKEKIIMIVRDTSKTIMALTQGTCVRYDRVPRAYKLRLE